MSAFCTMLMGAWKIEVPVMMTPCITRFHHQASWTGNSTGKKHDQEVHKVVHQGVYLLLYVLIQSPSTS